jgi:hypothetical protein
MYLRNFWSESESYSKRTNTPRPMRIANPSPNRCSEKLKIDESRSDGILNKNQKAKAPSIIARPRKNLYRSSREINVRFVFINYAVISLSPIGLLSFSHVTI